MHSCSTPMFITKMLTEKRRGAVGGGLTGLNCLCPRDKKNSTTYGGKWWKLKPSFVMLKSSIMPGLRVLKT
jgi:hypothetical protein